MQQLGNIAIVSINQNKYSETFIHNHVRLLPAKVHYLFGDYLPLYYATGVEVQGYPFLPDIAKSGWWNKLHGKQREPSIQERRLQLQDAITQYLKKNDIKAVLAEYGPSGVEMCEICQRAGIPLTVHFHGYDAYRIDMMKAFGGRYGEMFKQAAAVIGVSQHMMQRLRKMGAPNDKLHYNPYGADTRYFKPAKVAENPPVLLAIGRFAETKSPHLTILAFAQALKSVPEARLIMGGDGHLLLACKILAKAINIDYAVDFKGVISHEQTGKLMQQVRAFVQHSLTTPENDAEGTPVSIIEACASGLPVISTLHAGIPDVVIDGKTGFLVPEGDIDGMAKHMTSLLTQPDLAARLGKASYERVMGHFGMERHITRLAEIIAGTIKQRFV